MTGINDSTRYGTPAELRQAAGEARKLWKTLGAELRAADEAVREHNPLHNRFRPRSRAGNQVVKTLRAAMPADAQAAAVTADRLRQQRRCLNKTADLLANGSHLDLLACGPGLIGVDLGAAPILRRILDRWAAARAATDQPVPTDSASARRAATLARLEQLAARAARILESRQ